jgi:hypothetical protein
MIFYRTREVFGRPLESMPTFPKPPSDPTSTTLRDHHHTSGTSTSAFLGGSSPARRFLPVSHAVALKGSADMADIRSLIPLGHCHRCALTSVLCNAGVMVAVASGRAPWGGFLARLRVGPPPLSAPVGPWRAGSRFALPNAACQMEEDSFGVQSLFEGLDHSGGWGGRHRAQ